MLRAELVSVVDVNGEKRVVVLDGHGDLEALLHLSPKLVHKSSAVPDEKSKLIRSKNQRNFSSQRTVKRNISTEVS